MHCRIQHKVAEGEAVVAPRAMVGLAVVPVVDQVPVIALNGTAVMGLWRSTREELWR